jgi:hypothetical protein
VHSDLPERVASGPRLVIATRLSSGGLNRSLGVFDVEAPPADRCRPWTVFSQNEGALISWTAALIAVTDIRVQ